MKTLIEDSGIVFEIGEFKLITHTDLINWFNKIPKRLTKNITFFYVHLLDDDEFKDMGGGFFEDEDKYIIYLREVLPKQFMRHIFYHEIGHLIWHLSSKEEKDRVIANIKEEDIFEMKEELRDNKYWDYKKVCKGFYSELFAGKFAEFMDTL